MKDTIKCRPSKILFLIDTKICDKREIFKAEKLTSLEDLMNNVLSWEWPAPLNFTKQILINYK